MAHIPEDAHVVAYYLAKFPNSYENLDKNKTKTDLLLSFSRFFCMPDSSFKRLRDEYDAFFPHRAGYKGADNRASRKRIHDLLNPLSETDLHNKVVEIWSKRSIELGGADLECESPLWEGKSFQLQINKYERNRYARSACIAHHGARCKCCGLALSEIYGDIALDMIEVHHLKPIAEIGKDYQVDPINDLVPLCPNCHRVIHKKTPPFKISEIKEIIKSNNRVNRTGHHST